MDKCGLCAHSEYLNGEYVYCAAGNINMACIDPGCDWFEEMEEVTMDRNGVNEYIDDDYSNSTCDCRFCKEKESLRKVLITEQDGDDIEYEELEEMEDYTYVADIDDIGFDLVWDDTQKPEPPEDPMEEALRALFERKQKGECTCEECMDESVMQLNSYSDEGILLDIEDEIQAAEFCEVLAEEVESAMIEVLYAFETGEPKFGTLKKIDELRDLLYAMECIVISEE